MIVCSWLQACLAYCCFVELWSFTVLLVFKNEVLLNNTIILCEINSQLKHISAHLNVSGKDSEGVSSNMKISSKKVGQQLDIDDVSSDNDDEDDLNEKQLKKELTMSLKMRKAKKERSMWKKKVTVIKPCRLLALKKPPQIIKSYAIFHWVLIVIEMDSNTIYYLDPMRQPMHMDLKLLLNNAMARLNVKESASRNKVWFI
ncbi:hypothetical protein WN944_018845 [Citrus x changshan-huyou]|uniref:Ubiquitin-like protease family profile domain-containing protein n=1 Tax=Citrus x changshan-huyou TaxID=2935761 RepID=A0AAP0LXI3_9ROSI